MSIPGSLGICVRKETELSPARPALCLPLQIQPLASFAGDEIHENIDATRLTARTNMARKAEQVWRNVNQLPDEIRQRHRRAQQPDGRRSRERFTA